MKLFSEKDITYTYIHVVYSYTVYNYITIIYNYIESFKLNVILHSNEPLYFKYFKFLKINYFLKDRLI